MTEKFWSLHIGADGTPTLTGYEELEVRERELSELNDAIEDPDREFLFVIDRDETSGSLVIDSVWPRAYVCEALHCYNPIGRGEVFCSFHKK
jgi:hypothetical protein